MRNFFILLIFFTMAATVFADGFAYSKGKGKGKIITRIQETHQIAVIKLQEGSADVSMYIAITDIPEGETITYILPFWYKPDNFAMTKEKSTEKFTDIITPLNNKIKSLNADALYDYGNLLRNAYLAPVGIITTLFFPVFAKNDKSFIDPFKVLSTKHAKAMLYKINNDGKDLQQLIKQSGLSEKLIEPLRKYNTQYFAVMKLTGVKKDDNSQIDKGIMYTFSHKLTVNKYTYPLGTGAAWAKPIPLTEVFITCPDNMQLKVNAPEYGERISYHSLRSIFRGYIGSLNSPSYDIDDSDKAEITKTYTSSNLLGEVKNANIWHISYFMSNPDKDITAAFSKPEVKSGFIFSDFIKKVFLNDITPLILVGLCLSFSWYLTYLLVIIPYSKKHPEIIPLDMLKQTVTILVYQIIALNISFIFFYIVIPFLVIETIIGRKVPKWGVISQPDPDNKRLLCFWVSFFFFVVSTQSLWQFYYFLQK